MSTNLSFNAFQKKIEPHKCRVICMINGIGDPRPKSYLRSCKENNLEYSFKILIRILELFMLDLGLLRSYVILV
jgi:hypothetical protein